MPHCSFSIKTCFLKYNHDVIIYATTFFPQGILSSFVPWPGVVLRLQFSWAPQQFLIKYLDENRNKWVFIYLDQEDLVEPIPLQVEQQPACSIKKSIRISYISILIEFQLSLSKKKKWTSLMCTEKWPR